MLKELWIVTPIIVLIVFIVLTWKLGKGSE